MFKTIILGICIQYLGFKYVKTRILKLLDKSQIELLNKIIKLKKKLMEMKVLL